MRGLFVDSQWQRLEAGNLSHILYILKENQSFQYLSAENSHKFVTSHYNAEGMALVVKLGYLALQHVSILGVQQQWATPCHQCCLCVQNQSRLLRNISNGPCSQDFYMNCRKS
ncbi:hypothetical protein GUJ93_ZPchr0011g26874 [Zizania palustris]|uniref:Uncharacterized protein n=1 Tax=Zizania palustris TaxID=103762 RepID=A0A8J6BTN3_ZIZPA|nr:hypothetical protein GUJ93_ZPchr0011g26874 [Zizania palustris]